MIDTDKYEGHTQGPWRSYPMEDGGEEWYEIKCKSEPLGFISVHHENHVNSLLVADAPLLLQEVKRLRKIVAQLEDARIESASMFDRPELFDAVREIYEQRLQDVRQERRGGK